MPKNSNPTSQRRAINKNCLERIKQIMTLPQKLEVIDSQGNLITTVKMDKEGRVIDQKSKIEYQHPSHLRALLISPNGKTYNHFFYQGKSLADWGVAP